MSYWAPPRAFGSPAATGVLRAQVEDFIVEENLGFAPAGTGQHILLRVRKRNANTQWVARELAKLCQCRPMDVGYAGLKDRRAVAIQWFSVPQTSRSPSPWQAVRTPEFEILEAHAHTRKLPRGALTGNSFSLRIRNIVAAEGQLAERIRKVAERGVPNYFGPQRFGREGSNLDRLEAGLRALHPAERGFVLSAARSLIFNAVLAARVQEGSWERLETGDLANLDGRGSFFAVDETDPTLAERAHRLDIHPTGPMWGRGPPPTAGRIQALETAVAGQLSAAVDLVCEAGMEQERRSLRVAVRDLTWTQETDAVVTLRFHLTRGSFATTVIREIFDISDSELD